MKIFIASICMIACFYNLNKRNKNTINSNIPKLAIFGSIIILIFGIYVWNFYDKTILGIFPIIGFILMFLSSFMASGITENSFNVFSSKTFIGNSILFEKVKSVKIVYKNNKILIYITAYENIFLQEYSLKNENKLKNVLENIENVVYE